MLSHKTNDYFENYVILAIKLSKNIYFENQNVLKVKLIETLTLSY